MIRLKVRQDGAVVETFLVEDRADVGPEIRQSDQAGCDAGPSQPVDIDRGHCNTCTKSLAERLGISDTSLERLRCWREAAKMSRQERLDQGMTSAELGDILDLIVSKLDSWDEDCDSDESRIVLEVEGTP